jgi:ring-1,2-phenylacetyl-CoA epoxidase subunit PaaE
LNISKDKIFKEHFFIPEQSQQYDTDFSSLPDRTVTIHWQGPKYHVPVPSGKSILQAALDVGINLPYSCREAQCGTCRSRLLSGEVKMKRNHILTAEELEEGQVLLCQGYAMTDGVEVQPLHQPG